MASSTYNGTTYNGVVYNFASIPTPPTGQPIFSLAVLTRNNPVSIPLAVSVRAVTVLQGAVLARPPEGV